MKILVGNTGVVGLSLKEYCQFDYEYDSKNIHTIKDAPSGCDLYLSCLPATKWMINKEPLKDFLNIQSIYSELLKNKYSNVYLISTIDVYDKIDTGLNEDYIPKVNSFSYGSNRYLFEIMCKYLFAESLTTLRLPAVYGKHIKKNVLFDMLTENEEVSINTNSAYQWYNLEDLFAEINQLPSPGVYNLFPEPLETIELVDLVRYDINSTLTSSRVLYNCTSKHYPSGYIKSREQVSNEIKQFIFEYRSKPTSLG